MKDSGVEWIGDIPEDWEIIKTKRKFKTNKIIVGDKYTNFDRLSLTLNGVLKRPFDDNKGLQPQNLKTYQILNESDLIFKLIDLENVKTSRVGYSNYQGLVSPVYIRLINPTETRFGYYYYMNMWYQEIFNALGAGVRSSLSATDLLNIPYIFISSVKEKHNIVEFLDKKINQINSIISDTQQSITELKKYKQSLITETVTKGLDKTVEMKDSGIEWIGKIPKEWDVVKLKYLATIERGQFSHRPRNDERYYGGSYPFIQTGDVARSDKWIKNYSQTLSELGKNVSKEFKKGTLLMGIAANIGDVAILNFDSYLPDSVIGIKSNEGVSKEFLYYALLSQRAQLEYNATSSTQKNLNIESVGIVQLAYPCEKDIIRIVEYLNIIDIKITEIITDKEKMITEYEAYKKSLIYEYVTGKKQV